MICLNLPNNPTGTTLDHEEMHQLIQICKKHDLYVLVDEIYRGLYQEESISDLYEKGIATSGLSKVLSTPGLRIGWIKTKDKELIRLINERRDYFENEYDEIIYPELESVPFRFAISKRNEWMAEHSDLVIAYVCVDFGGAYAFFKHAIRCNKEVVNNAKLGNITNNEK